MFGTRIFANCFSRRPCSFSHSPHSPHFLILIFPYSHIISPAVVGHSPPSLKNTETASRRAGRLLGVCASQVSAALRPGRLWEGTVRQWSRSLAFHRFGDLRSFALEENADYTSMIYWARNGANRQKLAIESSALARKVQRSVRRVPTRLNRTHARAPFGFGVRRMGYVNSVRLTCADSEQVTSNA